MVVIGPFFNIVLFCLLVIFSWGIQRLFGTSPNIFSRFIMAYGINVLLDPIWILIVDSALMRSVYRKIFVHNIPLISRSDTVSDGATKTSALNIERAQRHFPKECEPDVLNTFQPATRVKKLTLLQRLDCMRVLALLPLRNCAVFQSHFVIEYHAQRGKTFTITKFHQLFKCLFTHFENAKKRPPLC